MASNCFSTDMGNIKANVIKFIVICSKGNKKCDYKRYSSDIFAA